MSKAKILALRGTYNHLADVVAEPDADLIKWLESLLADAKSGHMRGMAYVSVDRDRAITTNWCGQCDIHDMLAGMNMVNFRLMRQCDADDDTWPELPA